MDDIKRRRTAGQSRDFAGDFPKSLAQRNRGIQFSANFPESVGLANQRDCVLKIAIKPN